jgi:DNA-directed RNA polymerase subunit RPC12/RpoP
MQNVEGRLGDITTTNTQEDDRLNDLEAEANLKGTMTFRNWTDGLNEAIVGNKIVCDNCGWRWNIKDGGDSLYICHKCGHNNNPIQEKKNKDPFGITAYALELARGLEEQEGSKYKIYVDMDGVLVDFDGGYEKLTGITTREADKKGPEFFWKPISKAGAKWWITLKWMPDGKQLWDYVKKYNPELLSAPSREEASRMGKRVWVKRELPGVKLILRSADKKQEFASSNSILIDDREKNIEQWRNAGGVGILHTDAASTIKKLKELGL